MRRILLLFLPVVLLCGFCWIIILAKDPLSHPPALSKHALDVSIGIEELGSDFVLHRQKDQELRLIAHRLIDKRKAEWKYGKQPSIPRIIHQIWPSEDPIPDQFVRASRMVREHHPEFQYILWRPNDYSHLLGSLIDPSSAAISPDVTRDIVAAIVLWKFGGVVVDLESECVQPITPLLSLGDCLIGFEPPLPKPKKQRRLFVSSSVIASVPSNPLIQAYLTELLRRIRDGALNTHWITQDSLTTIVSSLALEQGSTLLVGPTFFCPVNPSHIRHLHKRLEGEVRRTVFQKISKIFRMTPPYSDISRETVFVHMNGGRASHKSLEKVLCQP